MKLSLGLRKLLKPLTDLIQIPEALASAIKKNGKRGNKPYYPNDLQRCNVVLETIHESGIVLIVEVINGNFDLAIQKLKDLVMLEDCNAFEYAA